MDKIYINATNQCIQSGKIFKKNQWCLWDGGEYWNIHSWLCMALVTYWDVDRHKRKKNPEVHMKMHNGEKPYQCIQCDKPFSKQVNLNIYLRIQTGEKKYPEMSYYCNICYKVFSLFISIFCKIYNIKISKWFTQYKINIIS